MHAEITTVKGTFLINCFNEIYYSNIGDFTVGKHIFKIGGKNKSSSQIKDLRDSYLAIDTDFTSDNVKIQLLLFLFIQKQ